MIKGLKLINEKTLGAESYYNKLEQLTNENGVNFTIYTKEMENVTFKHITLDKNGKALNRRNKEYKEIFSQLEEIYKTVNHYTLKSVKGIEVVEYK